VRCRGVESNRRPEDSRRSVCWKFRHGGPLCVHGACVEQECCR
jgi:hypothetical protein